MNSRLIGYKDAVKKLKVIGKEQQRDKKYIAAYGDKFKQMYFKQSRISKRKVVINFLLSIIAAHKQARKLYGQLKYSKGGE